MSWNGWTSSQETRRTAQLFHLSGHLHWPQCFHVYCQQCLVPLGVRDQQLGTTLPHLPNLSSGHTHSTKGSGRPPVSIPYQPPISLATTSTVFSPMDAWFEQLCSETIWYNSPTQNYSWTLKCLQDSINNESSYTVILGRILYCFENIVAIPMLCLKCEQTRALEDYIETSNATKVVI